MNFLVDGTEHARIAVLLGHGAGAPMDSPWMNTMTTALAGAGLRAVRSSSAKRRNGTRRPPPRADMITSEYLAAVEQLDAQGRLIIGGKSMGGRVASMIADDLHAAGKVAGLLCLGYPFHPPGKPAQHRTQHLATIGTPTLICQGTRDPFGTREEVSGYELSSRIEIVWVEDGDHDLQPRKRRSGIGAADQLRVLASQVTDWADRIAHSPT